MATTKVVRGTGQELIEYLLHHEGLDRLTLIIPAEGSGEELGTAYPEGAQRRNGVPLFPAGDRSQPVTVELVRQLTADED